MKQILLIKFILLFIFLGFQNHKTSAQNFGAGSAFDSTNTFNMPVGYMRIGDENYFGLRIQPELTWGKFGFGLDIPLMFSLDGNGFRNEEYNNGSGWFRLFSYIRYGRKKADKFYVRVGTLSNTYLGYGLLMNNYTNAASFERRKVGFEFDILYKKVIGLETIYSDFNGFRNIWAIRPYVRPLGKTDIPILKTLEFGVGLVSDRDKNRFDGEGNRVDTDFAQSGTTGVSVDLGASIVNTKMLNLRGFIQYANLGKNETLSDSVGRYVDALTSAGTPPTGAIADGYAGGSGFSIGAEARIHLIANLLDLNVRLERLWYNDHFLPQFFDATYEANKDEKLWLLANTSGVSGTYGVINLDVLNKIKVTGGLRIPDDVNDDTPALVHLSLANQDLIPKIILEANYVKGALGNLADAFKLDERSLFTVRVGYKVKKIFVVGMDYRWTFAKVEQDNGETKYEPVNSVMPYVGLSIPLSFGNNNN